MVEKKPSRKQQATDAAARERIAVLEAKQAIIYELADHMEMNGQGEISGLRLIRANAAPSTPEQDKP